VVARYVEFVDGKKQVARWPTGSTFTLTAGQTYGVQCVLDRPVLRRLRLYVDRNQDGDFGDASVASFGSSGRRAGCDSGNCERGASGALCRLTPPARPTARGVWACPAC
jgi:hypothetical protein